MENLRAQGLVQTDKHDDNQAAATNRITGKISLSEPKLLAFAIPYSPGFKVYVDGEEQTFIVKTVKQQIGFTVRRTHKI